MARKTIWEEMAPDAHRGLGQRILATDAGDVPLMDLRSLTVDPAAAEDQADGSAHG
jgi:type VI secretion system protein ImpE